MDPAAASTPRRRLPEELVTMVVDWCDYIRPEQARTRALAALCRLARRYKAHAEALLYSRISLPAGGQTLALGTLVGALVRNRALRGHVRAVELIDLGGCTLPVREILEDLPHVVEVRDLQGAQLVLEVLLAHNQLKIRRLSANTGFDVLKCLESSDQVREPFERLVALDLDQLPRRLASDVEQRRLSGVRSFGLKYGARGNFEHFTAPFCANLVALRLPVYSWSAAIDLGIFPHLERLAFWDADSVGDDPYYGHDVAILDSAMSNVVECLLSGAAVPSLTSCELDGMAQRALADDDPKFHPLLCHYARASPSDIPPSTARFLDALPPHLEHLSLTTSFLRPADVAAYLLSPRRPTALKTLRIGDEVGRGLGAILRREGGVGGEDSAAAAGGEEDGFGARSPARWSAQGSR